MAVSISYAFSVAGDVEKSTALGASINGGDKIRGQNVSGTVGGGRDSFSFTKTITSFGTDGDLEFYLNGEQLENTLTVEDNTPKTSQNHYKFYVDGEVLKSTAMQATIDATDTISRRTADEGLDVSTRDNGALGGETVVEGIVEGGRDSFVYSGKVTYFDIERNAKIRVNGELLTPADFARETITLESDGTKGSYAFAVSGDIKKSKAMGASINGSDTASKGTASGQVINGRDSYEFTGEITEFSAETNVRVYRNGTEINPGAVVNDGGSPDPATLPNAVTLSANTKDRVEYGFSVSGELAPTDLANGWVGDNAANGYGRGYLVKGEDAYTLSGEIQSVTNFDRIQVDIDRDNGRIRVVDFADNPNGPVNYEFTVSGDVQPVSNTDGSVDYVQDGTVRDEINDGTDEYDFTGDLMSLSIENSLTLNVENAYPIVVSNPYPDASVAELAINTAIDPNRKQIAFTTTALGDTYDLYLARGISSTDQVPHDLQRVSESVLAGVADLEWSSNNELRFWRDGFACSQQMNTDRTIYKPVAQANQGFPQSTNGGGA